MEKTTVIYTGTLIAEKDKIYLKDIAVKSDFNNLSGKFLDCITMYNTFSLENGFKIYYSENGEEFAGELYWDKTIKQWFIYDKEKDLFSDIRPGMIVSYYWDIIISDISELEVADENSEIKEIVGILKWLN
ncbi:hypothetical protein [Fusobacterium animalis]|uniref:hypothetical protein n=1 Tax=Fusobacterium animalis TaxID=76859 RepID=UPI0034DE3CF3